MLPAIDSHGMTIKKITLVGRSNENFVQATENAINRANDTMENLQWASVVAQNVQLTGSEPEYQTEVEVALELE
jgi:flavin-binding protein dodecin